MSQYIRLGYNLFDPVTKQLVGTVDLDGVERLGTGGGVTPGFGSIVGSPADNPALLAALQNNAQIATDAAAAAATKLAKPTNVDSVATGTPLALQRAMNGTFSLVPTAIAVAALVASAPFIAPTTPTYGAPTATWNSFANGADHTDQFNALLQGMVDGGVYLIPPGTVINHAYALGNREGAFALAKNVKLIVKGVTINATSASDCAVYCTSADGLDIIGDAATNIGCPNPGSRGSSFFRNAFTFRNSRGVRLWDGRSVGANAVGVFFHGCTDSFAARWIVSGSLADGFTIVGGSARCYTYDCEAANTGDDNFSVVSYAADPTNVDCGHVRPFANGNTNGRGTTIVGGTRCFIVGQKTRSTSSAGSMVAREANSDFETWAPIDCWIEGGTIDRPNYGSDDHGGILVLNQKANTSFKTRVGGIVVTNMQNTRPIVNCKNGNTGGASMDGTEVWGVTGSGDYYTGTPFSTDGSIPRTTNATGRSVAAAGVTFNGCVAVPAATVGGSSALERVDEADTIPFDSVSGKAMPKTPGQAVVVTTSRVVAVGTNPQDGALCVVDYEVQSGGGLNQSACIVVGPAIAAGYRWRTIYEYSQLEGKPYACNLQGSALLLNAPGAPSLTAGSATSTTQALTITPPVVDASHGAAASYTLQKSADGGTTWTGAATTGTAPNLTVTGLAESTAYQYRARASNATGDGPWSAVITASTAVGSSPILELFTPTGADPRNVGANLDFLMLGRQGNGNLSASDYVRKPGAGLLTGGFIGSAAPVGNYGSVGESWQYAAGVDKSGAATGAYSNNVTVGISVPNDSSTAQAGVYIEASSTTTRRVVIIPIGNFAGWVLHASDSSGGSVDIPDTVIPNGASLIGIRFRTPTAATIHIEIRKPVVTTNGTTAPIANSALGGNRDFCLVGATLVAA